MFDALPLERRLNWELTKTCNLRCHHCISRFFHDKVPGELSRAEVFQVVDRCAEAGIKAVHFFGGEPTCRPELPELLRRCDARGIAATFNTNGSNLSDELLETLATLEHWRPVLFSFEDCREEAQDAIRGAGHFRRALTGLRRYRAVLPAERPFVVAVTLTRPLLEEVTPAALLRFFTELGASHVVFQDLGAPLDAPRELKALTYDGTLWLDYIARLHQVPGAEEGIIPFTYQLKPLVTEYLNESLGLDLPLAYYGCNGLSTEFRLLPNGTLLPCSAAIGWPAALERYIAEAPTLVERSLAELLASSLYQDFSSCKVQRDVDPFMIPCRDCHLAFKKCNPCIFGRLLGQENLVPTCQWVREARGLG